MTLDELKQKYTYPDYILKCSIGNEVVNLSIERQSDGYPLIHTSESSKGNVLTQQQKNDTIKGFIESVLKHMPL